MTLTDDDVATAPFDLLTAAFPDFAPKALRVRCRTELADLPATVLAALDAEAVSRPEAFRNAVALWARNNAEMVQLAAGLRAGDRDRALADALRRRRTAMLKDVMWECVTEEIRNAAAQAKVANFELALQELATRMRPPAGVDIPTIHRGGAMPLIEFHERFAIGEVARWDGLTACTISPDCVPLFFAHKRVRELGAGADVAAFLLDIAPLPGRPLRLAWTGDVKGGVSGNDYRWQAEVVTAPGFAFTVDEVLRLPSKAPTSLFRVKGSEIA